MRVELKKLHQRLGTTAVYVTHDQVEAMTLGDRVVVMKDGLVQQVGEPLELYNSPANKFVAGFIGSPAMNFAKVTMTDGSGRLIARNGGMEIEVPNQLADRLRAQVGRQMTLGIRPEDLRVATSSDPPGLTFSSKVEVVEQLGSEILLDVRVGEETMVAAVDPTIRAKVAEQLRLAVNPERLHFFDAKTEAAI
jgi:multiple sugar transport system ATP-binding protein